MLVKNWMDRRPLYERGHVVWDVLDHAPPRDYIDAYLTSTELAGMLLGPCIRAHAVPHHHCNLAHLRVSVDRSRGRMVWIGSPHWVPQYLQQHGVEMYPFFALNSDRLAYLYGRADLLINARRRDDLDPNEYFLHTVFNSGIKVINAVGFGLPSVTEWEPWVDEIGPGCTIVCAPGEAVSTAKRVLQDEQLYETLRERCLAAAPRYPIQAIAECYRRVLADVASNGRR